MKYLFQICLLLPLFGSTQLHINEVMAKNENGLTDRFEDKSDWIEIYNETDSAVNLENWSIADKISLLNVYKFPSLIIPSEAYLVVFASGRNITLANEIHLPFKLDADGEDVYLTNPNGALVGQLTFPELAADISYGSFPDGDDNYVKYEITTPNMINSLGDTLIEFDWRFTYPSGFYKDEIVLEVLGDLPNGSAVHYTLNGREPTINDPILTGGLSLNEFNVQEVSIAQIPTGKGWHLPKEVKVIHVIKAQVYVNNKPEGTVLHGSYFINNSGNPSYSLPVISLLTEPSSFFANETGIYVEGDNENYFGRGEQWERPVHVEYFNKSGSLIFGQDAGVRIFGGTSRIKPQKSLKLFARKSYGKKTFDEAFFGEDYDDKFQRLVLRSLITDWGPSAMTDDLIQEIVHQKEESNFEYLRRSYAIVYLNGEYWGIHSLREDFSDEFIERKFGIPEDEVLELGNEFSQLLSYIVDNDMQQLSYYQYVTSQLEIDAFIDYMATEIFFGNIDWPRVNYSFWKQQGVGKWRPLLFDLDGTCKVYNEDLLRYVHDIQRYHSPVHEEALLIKVLGHLLENENFRQQFLMQLIELIQYRFTPDFTTGVQDELIRTLDPEMKEHIKRWNYPSSYSRWKSATDKLRDFLFMRPNWLQGLTFEIFDYPIHLYPNPSASTFVNLEIEMLREEVLQVSLVDLNQQVINLGEFNTVEGSNTFKIDLKDAPKGFYFISINGDKLFYFDKLIIQ
ncbi:MAG: hypothetical protein ACI9O4_001607 [Chitinophagales bacterium]|jgi:hypothetical protein